MFGRNRKKEEDVQVDIIASVPGVGYLLDVDRIEWIAFTLESLTCEDLQKLYEVLPIEHRGLIEAAMREKGCPAVR